MNWNVSRVSIPVFDLKKTVEFFNYILNEDDRISPQKKGNEHEHFILGGNIELKLFKLQNELKNDFQFQSKRTFVSLFIENTNFLIKNLIDNNINYVVNENKNTRSIFIQEPSFNYIELIDLDMSSNDSKNTSWNFHHINLESYDVRSSVNFISKYLKIKEGSWEAPVELGKVNIEKNQLAIFPLDKNHSGIHINKADFTFSWRNKFIHNPTIGGHPAFNVKDIKGFIKKLKIAKIPYSDAKVYAMPNIYQIYLFDPNANVIEINQNV